MPRLIPELKELIDNTNELVLILIEISDKVLKFLQKLELKEIMENKEINYVDLVSQLVALVPEVIAASKCAENVALMNRVKLIIADLTNEKSKIGDGKILAWLQKMLPVILQLLPLFMTPKE